MALRTGAAIIPGFALRTGPGFRYRTWFEPPLDVQYDVGDDEEARAAEVLRVTTELNARLEAAVRQAPEQWLWLHRRWKPKSRRHRRDTT